MNIGVWFSSQSFIVSGAYGVYRVYKVFIFHNSVCLCVNFFFLSKISQE